MKSTTGCCLSVSWPPLLLVISLFTTCFWQYLYNHPKLRCWYNLKRRPIFFSLILNLYILIRLFKEDIRLRNIRLRLYVSVSPLQFPSRQTGSVGCIYKDQHHFFLHSSKAPRFCGESHLLLHFCEFCFYITVIKSISLHNVLCMVVYVWPT